jgi:hypothetical protein
VEAESLIIQVSPASSGTICVNKNSVAAAITQ